MSEHISYEVFSLRLHEETKSKLIIGKEQSGLSWNRYVLTLVDEDYKKKLLAKNEQSKIRTNGGQTSKEE